MVIFTCILPGPDPKSSEPSRGEPSRQTVFLRYLGMVISYSWWTRSLSLTSMLAPLGVGMIQAASSVCWPSTIRMSMVWCLPSQVTSPVSVVTGESAMTAPQAQAWAGEAISAWARPSTAASTRRARRREMDEASRITFSG